ncbi:MAG: hypothetical protein V3W11_07450 [bacterium]
MKKLIVLVSLVPAVATHAETQAQDNTKNAAFGAATCAGSALLFRAVFPAEEPYMTATGPWFRELRIVGASTVTAVVVSYVIEETQPTQTLEDVEFRFYGALAYAAADLAFFALTDGIKFKPYRAGLEVEMEI